MSWQGKAHITVLQEKKKPPYFQIKEGTGVMTSICFLQAGMHRLPEAEVKK